MRNNELRIQIRNFDLFHGNSTYFLAFIRKFPGKIYSGSFFLIQHIIVVWPLVCHVDFIHDLIPVFCIFLNRLKVSAFGLLSLLSVS
ncbi:hypothetical protein D3C85_1634330 [compost metagenome]